MNRHFFQVALSVAALAGFGSAHATAITFDGDGLDTSNAPLAPYFLLDKDVLTQNGMAIGSFNINNESNESDGSITGALINGTDSTCTVGLICPTRNSNYLASLNDGVVGLFAFQTGRFRLSNFTASFIGPVGATNTQASGVSAGAIRLFGVKADGTSGFLSPTFWLNGTDTSGKLKFDIFSLTQADRDTDFVEIDFVGYGCDSSGDCNAFSTNRGQFALDDIEVTAIPEPSAVWLLGAAGLAAFGAARLRRRSV